MSIFDDIRKDREAGTSGRWDNVGVHRYATEFGVYSDGGRSICSTGSYSDGREVTHYENVSNAKRIARVPDLEAIALAAEELAVDLSIAADNAQHAAKTDYRWEGVSEKLRARLREFREACK